MCLWFHVYDFLGETPSLRAGLGTQLMGYTCYRRVRIVTWGPKTHIKPDTLANTAITVFLWRSGAGQRSIPQKPKGQASAEMNGESLSQTQGEGNIQYPRLSSDLYACAVACMCLHTHSQFVVNSVGDMSGIYWGKKTGIPKTSPESPGLVAHDCSFAMVVIHKEYH